MGYRSPKTLYAPTAPAQFLAALDMDAARVETSRWRAVHFLFQLTGDELPAPSRGGDPNSGDSFQRGAIGSFVFLAIDLVDGAGRPAHRDGEAGERDKLAGEGLGQGDADFLKYQYSKDRLRVATRPLTRPPVDVLHLGGMSRLRVLILTGTGGC